MRNGDDVIQRHVGEVGEVVRQCIAQPHAEDIGGASADNRLSRRLDVVHRYAGKEFLHVVERRGRHLAQQAPVRATGCNLLQPARLVGKVLPLLAQGLTERLAKVLIPLEADGARHANQRIGLDGSRIRQLADGGDPDLMGVVQDIARRLAQLRAHILQAIQQPVHDGLHNIAIRIVHIIIWYTCIIHG